MDSRSNLWVGGDNNRSLDSNGKQHTVGFTPFAPRTVTAPSAPPKLSVQRYGSTAISYPGLAFARAALATRFCVMIVLLRRLRVRAIRWITTMAPTIMCVR